jgi:hypothetical protein
VQRRERTLHLTTLKNAIAQLPERTLTMKPIFSNGASQI